MCLCGVPMSIRARKFVHVWVGVRARMCVRVYYWHTAYIFRDQRVFDVRLNTNIIYGLICTHRKLFNLTQYKLMHTTTHTTTRNRTVHIQPDLIQIHAHRHTHTHTHAHTHTHVLFASLGVQLFLLGLRVLPYNKTIMSTCILFRTLRDSNHHINTFCPAVCI
jgi:hypothetical protein